MHLMGFHLMREIIQELLELITIQSMTITILRDILLLQTEILLTFIIFISIELLIGGVQEEVSLLLKIGFHISNQKQLKIFLQMIHKRQHIQLVAHSKQERHSQQLKIQMMVMEQLVLLLLINGNRQVMMEQILQILLVRQAALIQLLKITRTPV